MDDLISRQAAIDAVRRSEALDRAFGYGHAVDALRELPSAQPEITEKQVKEYCEKRCLIVLSSDAFHRLKSGHPERCEDCGNFNKTRLVIPQPERKKGKWIKNDNGTYSCDQCHSWIPNEQHYYARYCIFCGAPMEVEE